MAKKNTEETKEQLTLEERLALAEERAEKAEAAKAEAEQAKAEAEKQQKLAKEETASALNKVEEASEKAQKAEKALEASKENNPNAKLVVPGVYKSTKTKKNYGFKLGHVNVRKRNGEVVPAVDVLEDAETMEWLIKIGSAIIEEK